jgi:thioredoxin-related protein
MKFLISVVMLVSALLSAELDWPNDYKAALKQASKEKKDVYMLVTSQSCRWCRKFESTTLQDEVILERLKQKYVLLHVDRDADFIPAKFKKERVPRHYFITAKSEVIYSFLGYWSSEDFDSFLDDVERKYKKKFTKTK